jgi:U3 small nucleolar RNA-associated protein 14
MDRIERLACRWDEDERAPPRAIGVTPLKEEPYVPITKILKEFYQEERDRLYCHEWWHGHEDHNLWHEELSSQESISTEESDSSKEESASNVTEDEVQDDPLVRIVEDSIYKKFSYM